MSRYAFPGVRLWFSGTLYPSLPSIGKTKQESTHETMQASGWGKKVGLDTGCIRNREH